MWFHFLSKTECKFHLNSWETSRFIPHFFWNSMSCSWNAEEQDLWVLHCSLRLIEALIEVRKVFLYTIVKLRLDVCVQGRLEKCKTDQQGHRVIQVESKKILIEKNVQNWLQKRITLAWLRENQLLSVSQSFEPIK